MTAVVEELDIEQLVDLFAEEAGCQLKPTAPHPCSRKATHILRMRCGSQPNRLACLSFKRFVEEKLAADPIWVCAACETQVRVCWELIPV